MIDLAARTQDFQSFQKQFDALSEKELSELLDTGGKKSGWGWSCEFEFAGRDFFAKGIPLTELELNNPGSTANLYQLPVFYHYGVGSAGFGAYRELQAQLKLSDFVLSGQCPHFPLLFHTRTVKIDRAVPGKSLEASYFEYWDNNDAIRHYVGEREKARLEVVMILEHFDLTVNEWILSHQTHIPLLGKQMKETCSFLESRGMLHMDLHFKNLVYKECLFALVDYGLVMDREHEMNQEEQEFFQTHQGYDLDQFYLSLAFELFRKLQGLNESKKKEVIQCLGLKQEAEDQTVFIQLMRMLENDTVMQMLSLKEELINCLQARRERILAMFQFFGALRDDSSKQARYPQFLQQ